MNDQAVPVAEGAESALQAEIEAALVGRRGRVQRIKLRDGRLLVIKRAVRRRRPLWVAILARRAARRLGQGRPTLRQLRAGGQASLDHEAARLINLRSAGWAVPRVVTRRPGWLALEHVGEPVNGVLRDLDQEGQAELVTELVRGLARFHAAGHWHGRCRLSHHTWRKGLYYRTGFEEDLVGRMPLSTIQAFDLFSIIHSTLPLQGQDLRAARQLGRRLLTVYFSNHGTPAVWEAMIRADQHSRRLLALLSRFEHWHGRDLLRLALLRELIGDLGRASAVPGR